MKKVIIIGASGNIATQVTDILVKKNDINLTLFLRKKSRLRNSEASRCYIIEGDVLNYEKLKEAISGQDIVYVNLAGDLGAMARNIIKAMKETGVKRVIFTSSIGIYSNPVQQMLKPYREAADIFESSNLEYTILRPTWFTNANEVDYELTRKRDPEKGSVISQKSLATFIAKIIEEPWLYVNENLGINKPNS